MEYTEQEALEMQQEQDLLQQEWELIDGLDCVALDRILERRQISNQCLSRVVEIAFKHGLVICTPRTYMAAMSKRGIN